MADLIGKQLGQYVIIEQIGRGGMASVYRAHQAAMDRDVAIKVMDERIAHDPDFIARFDREVKLIAKLQHPHILPVYDYGHLDDLTYLVMRLIDGQSLDNRLRGNKLDLPSIIKIFDQISQALAYAHANGVVHRDLKPNNILLDSVGNAYLTDFGIAKMTKGETKLTKSGMIMGTPSYMAPELWRGEPADARADIYALGIMLYEMLTGEPPFAADTPYEMMYKHIDTPLPSPARLRPDIPREIADAVHTATAKTPDKRYGSAIDFAEAVRAGYTGQLPPLSSVTPSGKGTAPIEQSTPVKRTPAKPTPVNQLTNPQPLDASLNASTIVPEMEKRETPSGRPRWAFVAAIGAVVIIGILALAILLRGQPQPAEVANNLTNTAASVVSTTVAPTIALITLTPVPEPTSLPTIVPTVVTLTAPPTVATTVPNTVPPTQPTTVAPATVPPTTPPTTPPTAPPPTTAQTGGETSTAPNTTVAPTAVPTIAPTITPSGPSVRIEVFRDADTLTLYLPDTQKVSLEALAVQVQRPNGKIMSQLLKDYPAFSGLPFDSIGGPRCFILRTGTHPTSLPLACSQMSPNFVVIQKLAPGDLIWFDNVANAPLTISLMNGDTLLGQCPANEVSCEILLPIG